MMSNYSRQGDEIRALGLDVAVSERIGPRGGERRYVSLIVSPAERLVASYWCEPSGEWAGTGWVGLGAGCATWAEFLAELQSSVAVAA